LANEHDSDGLHTIKAGAIHTFFPSPQHSYNLGIQLRKNSTQKAATITNSWAIKSADINKHFVSNSLSIDPQFITLKSKSSPGIAISNNYQLRITDRLYASVMLNYFQIKERLLFKYQLPFSFTSDHVYGHQIFDSGFLLDFHFLDIYKSLFGNFDIIRFKELYLFQKFKYTYANAFDLSKGLGNDRYSIILGVRQGFRFLYALDVDIMATVTWEYYQQLEDPCFSIYINGLNNWF
jgi:hypothetical protein